MTDVLMPTRSPSRWRRIAVSAAAVGLIAAPLTLVNAGAALAVDVGNVEARITNHLGYPDATNTTDGNATGNCIRYAPAGDATSSDWVGSGEEALTAHGSRNGNCPNSLSTATQSALGFAPGAGGELPLGGVASLGTITHYNNPVQANNAYYRGNIEVRTSELLDEAGDPAIFEFPWFLHETLNSPGDVDDFTRITVQSPETIVHISDGAGGTKPYRMVVAGFAASADACAAGTYTNEWYTKEGANTTATMCGQLTQVRSLEIEKKVELPAGFTGTVPEFGFTASSTMTNLDGVATFWNGDFSLAPTATASATTEAQDVLVPNQVVTVTENAVDGWELANIECSGVGVSTSGSTITFAGEEVATQADLPAKCTVTNRPIVQPLTIEKNVADLAYVQDYEWTITKTVDPDGTLTNPAASGTEFDYQVTVTPDAATKRDGTYTTNLTVTNPNAFPVSGVTLADEKCTVAGADANFDLAANETKSISLDCTADEVAATTNTATLSWTDPYGTAGNASSNEAAVDFANATVTPGNNAEVTVTDTFPEFAAAHGTVKVKAADGPASFDYAVTHTSAVGTCEQFTNTATIVETEQSASTDAKVCNQAALETSKNVVLDLERTYSWSIDKSANASTVVVDPATGKAEAEYTVTVTEGEASDDHWSMTGVITVVNPNDYKDATVTVTDTTNIGGGAICTVENGVDAVIPAGESVDFAYNCSIPEQPLYDGTNTATVVWADATEDSVFTAEFTAADWKLDEKVKETTVTDTFPEFAELEGTTIVWSEAGKTHEFTYTHEFAADELPEPGQCNLVTNTASLSTGGVATADVDVCSGLLSLVKSADVTSGVEVGDKVTYTFVATNESASLSLTDVAITDLEAQFTGGGELSALSCDAEAPVTLAPGEKLTCTAEYTVVEADLDAGKIDNVAEATSNETPKVTDDETVTTADKPVPPTTTPVPPTEAAPVAPKPGSTLPSTGADANYVWIGGLALVLVAAGVVLAVKKRRDA